MKKLIYWLPMLMVASSAWALQSQSPQATCSRLKPESARKACYDVIAGASFDELAVGVCATLTEPADVVSCMKMISNLPYRSHVAVKVCSTLEVANEIIDCLNMVSHELVQDRAAQVCGRMKTAELRSDCIDAITGKDYTQSEFDECVGKTSAEEKIQCFDDIGHYGK